ncbi:MAG: TatD family hydrolase [Bacteroidota bacterium]
MDIEKLLIKSNFIDIHTHNERYLSDVLKIICILSHDVKKTEFKPDMLYSIGFHPWYLQDDTKGIRRVIKSMENEQIIAIGEVGLDRLTTSSIDKQKEIFIKQIQIALAFQKPLIIHCVKAYSDCLELFKSINPSVAVIFHGYNGNSEITEKLSKWNAYFSFGYQLLNKNENVSEIFKTIPPDRVFFETDMADISIVDVYSKAAELVNKDVISWIEQIKSNFLNVFKKN